VVGGLDDLIDVDVEGLQPVRLLREALDLARDLPDDDPGRSSAVHVLGPALQMTAAKRQPVRAAIIPDAVAALLRRAGGEWPPTSSSSSRRPTQRSGEPSQRVAAAALDGRNRGRVRS
jgi:hypothetical protein